MAGVPASPTSTEAPASDTGGLTEAEAFAKAKRSGEPVEVASLRGESSEVYATPEGDLEAREICVPSGPGSKEGGSASTPS
ncbi:hypothetical protein ACR6C2_16240 [Streptomyces sp. INA 01156]